MLTCSNWKHKCCFIYFTATEPLSFFPLELQLCALLPLYACAHGLFRPCWVTPVHSSFDRVPNSWSFGYVLNSKAGLLSDWSCPSPFWKLSFHGEPLPGFKGPVKIFYLRLKQTLPSGDAFESLCLWVLPVSAFTRDAGIKMLKFFCSQAWRIFLTTASEFQTQTKMTETMMG